MKPKTEIETKNATIEVKETYGTIKRRMLAEGSFFEVTMETGKMMIAKWTVEKVEPISK